MTWLEIVLAYLLSGFAVHFVLTLQGAQVDRLVWLRELQATLLWPVAFLFGLVAAIVDALRGQE